MKKIISFFAAALVLLACGCSSANSRENVNKDESLNRPIENKNENNNNGKNMENLTKVLIKTSLGDITIALYDETPKHKENFIKLVQENYYDNVLFHRIIKNFMILLLL